ncbi:hypothetical protein GF356_05780 [candidate division GN15 bacterium]|nr:hypothetical protein [candidate division GN15 bacterium]
MLVVASFMVIFGGIAILIAALFFRTEHSPSFSRLRTHHPRNWLTPIWKQRDWFTSAGFVLYVGGIVVFVGGCAIRLILSL